MRNLYGARLSTFAILFHLLLVSQSEGQRSNLKTLRLVQVIMRHGQRNQLKTYPLDPYKDEQQHWPAGFGQLTDVGVQQTYELGQYLRSRYDGFLNATYNQFETFAMSSGVERAIRSGLSALNGLYPSVEGKSRMSGLGTGNDCLGSLPQVVPIRTVPREEDNFIHMDRKCPLYDKESQHLLRDSEEIRRWNLQYPHLTRLVNKNAGLNVTKVTEEVSMFALEALNAQRLQGIQLPRWVTPELIHFTESYFVWYMKSMSNTPVLKKLRSGIVAKVYEHMKDKLEANNDPASRRKFILISGHDLTVITFLNVIGAFNNLPAPYTAAVLIELHKDEQHRDHYIEVYYRNDTTAPPYKLQPSFCSEPCFFADFQQFVTKIVPQDWEKACEVNNSGPQNRQYMPVVAVIIGIFSLFRSF